MNIYSQSKKSEFTVQLPKSIDLAGPWKVGVAEIQYPNCWYNIDDAENHWIYHRHNLVFAAASIAIGFYQNPRHVVEQLIKYLKRNFHNELSKALNDPE